nr:MAG TPA: hypothetical protein [Caudoviricetes sp.]
MIYRQCSSHSITGFLYKSRWTDTTNCVSITCISWLTNAYSLCTTSRWSYCKITSRTISKCICSISILCRYT